jgi:hypothetical protein
LTENFSELGEKLGGKGTEGGLTKTINSLADMVGWIEKNTAALGRLASAATLGKLKWLEDLTAVSKSYTSVTQQAQDLIDFTKSLFKESAPAAEETNKLIIKIREQAAALQENNANWLDFNARLRAGKFSASEMTVAMGILNDKVKEGTASLTDAVHRSFDREIEMQTKKLRALASGVEIIDTKVKKIARDPFAQAKIERDFFAVWDKLGEKVDSESGIMGQSLSSALAAGGNEAADQVVLAMHGARLDLKSIFSAMADDFVRYFVQQAVIAMSGSFSSGKGILGFLGSLFDNPTNDAMAARQGFDFGRHFAKGFTKAMTPGGANFSPALAATGGSRTTALSIHFHGPVTDQAFVRNTIVPAIERAASEGTSRIAMNKSNLTGRATYER